MFYSRVSDSARMHIAEYAVCIHNILQLYLSHMHMDPTRRISTLVEY